MSTNNKNLNQLVSTIRNLRENTNNLHRDLDDRDQREETQQDLSQIAENFTELRTILSNLDQDDTNKIQDELKQLLKGEQNFQDYTRDINKILGDVRKRIDTHQPTKEKVQQNLPQQQRNEQPGPALDNWQALLNKAQKWIEENLHASRS